MNNPFGNNRGLVRTPRRPDRLQGAVYKGPAVINGDQRRWGIWAAGYGGQNNASGDLSFGIHDRSARTSGYATGLDYLVTSQHHGRFRAGRRRHLVN
jgi:hypothetical protein